MNNRKTEYSLSIPQGDLMKLVQQHYESAEIYASEIAHEREEGLRLYEMRPLGNEQDGLSKAKTSDVADTVDWLMPQLQEMLCGAELPVEFAPINMSDVEQAKQEEAYVWHVLNQENEGYLVTHTWHKDALVQKNGIIKVYWEEKAIAEKECYYQLEKAEYEALLLDDQLEVEKVEEAQEERLIIDPFSGAQVSVMYTYYNVDAVRSRNNKQVRIVNIAPENFFICRAWTSVCVDAAPYVAHRERVPVAELIAMGVDASDLEGLEGATMDYASSESLTRYEDEGGWSGIDESTKYYVWVTEHYIRVDPKNNGKEILACVRTVGDGGGTKIIEGYEVDTIPFVAITPDINSHRFWGRSIADTVGELQKIKTALMRQTLDNLYRTNMPRPIITEGMVNMDDLLNVQIGRPIREMVSGALRFETVPFAAANTLPLFEYIDRLREDRTGVSRQTQGLDPDALKTHTAFAAGKLLSAAQQRILMIARTFAEIGYRALFCKIHELACKHERTAKIISITGKYVEVNPASWRKRTATRAAIGTGRASKMEKAAILQGILDIQREIVAAQGAADGIVNLRNVYNALRDFLDCNGVKNADLYFTPPDQIPIKEAEQPTMGAAEQVALADIEARRMTEIEKLNFHKRKEEEALMLEREKEANKSLLEREKLLMQKELKLAELSLQKERDEREAEFNDIKLLIESKTKAAANSAPTEASESPVKTDVLIQGLTAEITELKKQIKEKKEYSFSYDQKGRIVNAESQVSI